MAFRENVHRALVEILGSLSIEPSSSSGSTSRSPGVDRQKSDGHRFRDLFESGSAVEQARAIETIRERRHEIAHELARPLIDPDAEVSAVRLEELHGIMRSLDAFFGGLAVDSDPQFDDVDVDSEEIVSGSGMLLNYLRDISESVSHARSAETT